MPTTTRYSILRKKGPSNVAFPPAGWVGSKAGTKGDFITLDSNGRVDQAAAGGSNIGSTTRVALLATPSISSSATAGAACAIEKLDDDTLIELQATSSDSLAATANSMVGKRYEVRRITTELNYTVDTSTGASSNPTVEVVEISKRFPVGTSGGTLICRVIGSQRIL